MSLPSIEIVCSDKGSTARADVLEKSNRRIKVAMGVGNNSITLILTKNPSTNRFYVGNKFGLEFTTTGEEIQ